MDLMELSSLMVEKGAIIRAIPFFERSQVEVCHAEEFKNKPNCKTEIVFCEEYGRDMLYVEQKLSFGGKFLVSFQQNQMAQARFAPHYSFNSLEDAVDFVKHYSNEICIGKEKFRVGGAARLIKEINGKKEFLKGVIMVKEVNGTIQPYLRLTKTNKKASPGDMIPLSDSDDLKKLELWELN